MQSKAFEIAKAVLVFMVLVLNTPAVENPPPKLWSKSITAERVFFGGCDVDTSGNCYVLVWAYNASIGGRSFAGPVLAIKFSPDGELLWVSDQGMQPRLGWEGFQNIRVDTLGNCYLFGSSDDSYSDAIVKKLDASGILVSSRILFSNPGSTDVLGDVDSDGNLYVGGREAGAGYVRSFTSSFQPRWTRSFSGAVEVSVWGLGIGRDGTIGVAGIFHDTVSFPPFSFATLGDLDGFGAVLDRDSGVPKSAFQLWSTNRDDANAVVQISPSNDWIFAGARDDGAAGLLFRKASQQWQKSTRARIASLAAAGGRIYAADGGISCFDLDGNVLWQSSEKAEMVKATDSGHLFAAAHISLSELSISHFVVGGPPPADIPVEVSTLAGSGQSAFLNSDSPTQASFNSPGGVAVNQDGVIFVADSGNHVIRFILPSGVVGTWAGAPDSPGYLEGFGVNALFKNPLGLALNSVGDLLVTDSADHRVRKVLGLGYRSTSLLAGDGIAGFSDELPARVNSPGDAVESGSGEVYFTDTLNHVIRRTSLNGAVSVIAGTVGVAGFQDGFAEAARFNSPSGLAFSKGYFYVADSGNNRIRKLQLDAVATVGGVLRTGVVTTTIAGDGLPGLKNAKGTAAELGTPLGIVADPSGNLFVSESSNNAIRRIDTNGWVTLLAGTGVSGFSDGNRDAAKFAHPRGLAFHPDGSLLVADAENHRIRRIVLDGKTNSWVRDQGFLTMDLNPTLKIYGDVGDQYRIECRDRLGPANWVAVESVALSKSPQEWVDPRHDGAALRIYRAIKE